MKILCHFLLFTIFSTIYSSQFTYAPDWDSKYLSKGFPTPDGKPWDDQNVYMRYLMDADGDGRLDIAGFGYGFFVSLSCGQGFGEPFMWMDSTAYSPSTGWPNYNTYPRLVTDINNDGYNDIIAFGSSVMVSQFVPATNSYEWKGIWSSEFASGSYSTQNTAPRLVGDFDGDGFADVVGFHPTDGLRVEKGTGTSLNSATVWLADFLEADGWDTFDVHPRFVVDVNGDGKDDVVGCGPNGVLVAISTGSSFTASVWLTDFSVSQGWTTYQQFPRAMADVDGDGKADLIGFKDGVYVALAGTSSFGAPTLWYNGLSYSSSSSEWLTYNAAPRFLGDVNCDGKADIVAFSGTGGGITVYMSGTSTTDSCTALSSCSLCQPGSGSCTFCETLPRWPASSGGCQCPGNGILAYASAKCNTKNPTIALSSTVDCLNVDIYYEIPAEEIAAFSSVGVLVKLTDTGSNPTKTAEIQSLLDSQFTVSGSSMTIPRSSLVSGVTYTLNMSRYIAEGTIVYNTTTFSLALGSQTSFVETSGKTSCYFLRDSGTAINGEITSGACPQDVVVTISQIAGPTVDDSYIVNTSNYSKEILPCAFKEGNQYVFQIEGSSASDSSFSISKNYDYTVPYDEIKVSIPNASPIHDYNSPITISPTITNSRNCPFESSVAINYLYTCTRRSPNTVAFVACPDPNTLFDLNTTSNSLTIPTSYLEQSSDMIISVTVYAGPRAVSASTYYNITNQNNLVIAVSCLSTQCGKYNPNVTYELLATVTNDPGSGYDLNWFASNPSLTTFANFTQLKFSGATISGSSLTFNVLVQSSTYTGTGIFSLPINTPPTPGDFLVSPSSGLSFLTEFSLSANGWTDEDQPLMYKYTYFFNNGSANAITQAQLSPTATTYLPGDNPAIDVIIILNVYDSYGAVQSLNKSVSVNSNNQNLDATINSISGIVDVMSTSLQSTILQSALIADEMKNSQDDLMALRANLQSCTGCAVGEIFCLYGQCNCRDLTNSVVDCSISTSLINKSLALNEALIGKIDETYRYITMNSPNLTESEVNTLKESALSSFKAISANPVFNSNTTIQKIYDSLNNTLMLLSPSTTLTYTQSATVAGFMSNSYQYFSSFSDCNCTTDECLSLEKRTSSYLEKISSDSCKNQIAGSNPTYISTDIFDLATRRTSICDVASGELAPSTQSASISFYKLSKKNDTNCKTLVDSYYYAFPNRSTLFNCNSTMSNAQKTKDFIMIKMVDGNTQKSVADKFSVVPTMPPGISCPKGCSGEVGGSCFCAPSLFDVGAQLAILFKRSNLYAFSNIGALLNWKWYTSPMFWVNIGFLAWYLITVYNLRKKKYRDMCVIDNVKPVSTLDKKSAVKNIVFVASNILSMYFLKKSELTKITRVTLYYFRLILHGTFASIFSNVDENKTFLQLLQELQIYVILLPYFTVIPINLLFTKILTDSSKRLNVTKGEKCKTICTGFLMTLVILGGIFAMFVVAANKSEGAQLPWAVILVVSFIQDIFVSPIVFVIIQTIFTQLVIFATKKNHPKLLKVLTNKVDENFNQVFVKLPIHPKYKLNIVELKAKEQAKQNLSVDTSLVFAVHHDENTHRKASGDIQTEQNLLTNDTPRVKAPLSRFHQQALENKKVNEHEQEMKIDLSKVLSEKKEEGDEEEVLSMNDIEIAKKMGKDFEEAMQKINAEPFTLKFDSEIFDEKHPTIDLRTKD